MLGAARPVQQQKDAGDPPNVGLRQQSWIARFVVEAQAAVAEASDHDADLSSLLISGGGLKVGDREPLNPQSGRALSRLGEVVAGLEREPDAIAAAERHV